VTSRPGEFQLSDLGGPGGVGISIRLSRSPGLLDGLAGLGLGLPCCWGLPAGGMGAGDVKASAALGAWLGLWRVLFLSLVYMGICGGLIILSYCCGRGVFCPESGAVEFPPELAPLPSFRPQSLHRPPPSRKHHSLLGGHGPWGEWTPALFGSLGLTGIERLFPYGHNEGMRNGARRPRGTCRTAPVSSGRRGAALR